MEDNKGGEKERRERAKIKCKVWLLYSSRCQTRLERGNIESTEQKQKLQTKGEGGRRKKKEGQIAIVAKIRKVMSTINFKLKILNSGKEKGEKAPTNEGKFKSKARRKDQREGKRRRNTYFPYP